MEVQKQISIYLTKKREPQRVKLVQYDTGVQLVFLVADLQIPNGTTATLFVQKPSGKFVYQDTNITVADNSVIVDLHNQAITESGDAKYQLQLVNGSDTISTLAGVLDVGKSLKDDGAVESKTVVRAFDELCAQKLAELAAATLSATHDGAGNVTLTMK
jgi:hypothetical protein